MQIAEFKFLVDFALKPASLSFQKRFEAKILGSCGWQFALGVVESRIKHILFATRSRLDEVVVVRKDTKYVS